MDEGNRSNGEERSLSVPASKKQKPVRMYPGFGREVANVTLRVIAFIFITVFAAGIISAMYEQTTSISDGTCNIAVLPVEGVILPYDVYTDAELVITPRAVRTFLADAAADENIEGVLLEINSPGGTPVAAEQIAEQIDMTELPVVGLIGDIGLSGGYLVSASTDHLIASEMSEVGSIGVTMSYLSEVRKNEEEGIDFVHLSTGAFKDAGNPNKELTEEERTLFERDLEIVHKLFIKRVAEYRGKTVEEITALADGSAMTGLQALGSGLIDGVGGRKEAREYFAAELGVPDTDVQFCEYQYNSLIL